MSVSCFYCQSSGLLRQCFVFLLPVIFPFIVSCQVFYVMFSFYCQFSMFSFYCQVSVFSVLSVIRTLASQFLFQCRYVSSCKFPSRILSTSPRHFDGNHENCTFRVLFSHVVRYFNFSTHTRSLSHYYDAINGEYIYFFADTLCNFPSIFNTLVQRTF